MAISFNPYLRGTSGLINQLRLSVPFNGTMTLRVYAGAFPAAPIEATASLPGSWLASFSTLFATVEPASIQFTTGGTLTVNGSSTGTANWFSLTSSTNSQIFISDSVGLNGDNQILTLSTLNIVSGQSVQALTFNLRLV